METMPHYAEEFFKVPKTMKFGKTEFSLAGYFKARYRQYLVILLHK
jgi:hypothetical protein